MRIKHAYIKRYGPLQDKTCNPGEGLTILMGSNDQGKTLTIDALIKMILGKKDTRNFEQIDRVGENPEGYAVLLDAEGQEIKVPEKGCLDSIAGLTSEECRNIFIIRNSDLSISRESQFYNHITDRLTGLRTQEIDSIIKKLREEARITPGGAFTNVQGVKLKERIEKAKGIVQSIAELEDIVKKEGYDNIEEELAALEKEKEITAGKLENLENARKREMYEKAKAALEKLTGARDNLEELKSYGDEQEQAWRDSEKSRQNLHQDIDELQEKLEENKGRYQKVLGELKEKEQELQVLEEKKNTLDNEVRPDLKSCLQKREDLKEAEEKSRQLTPMGACSALMLGISLIGSIISSSPLFIFLTFFFLAITIALCRHRVILVRERASCAGLLERINLVLSRYGMRGDSLEEILEKVNKFAEDQAQKVKQAEALRTDQRVLREKIDELQNKYIPQLKEKTRRAEEVIESIKLESKEETLRDYSSRLRDKKETERILGEQKSILEHTFGTVSYSFQDNLTNWGQKVKDLEGFRKKARDTIYDDRKVIELEERRADLEDKLEESSGKLRIYKEKLLEVEKEANRLLQQEKETDYLPCSTSLDLGWVKKKVQDFIDEKEKNREAAQRAVSIFEDLEAEEKKKVSRLFGRDSDVSCYLQEITGGLYQEVVFSQEKGNLEIKRRDGVLLEPEKLSGGSYDQLYFSIRLALGEKLLKGKKGFFILDDPFIKADYERLCRQMQAILKISRMGWQVIYFSAKKETREVLEKEINSGTVNCLEIEDL